MQPSLRLSAPATKDSFPPGLNNAFFFATFNALSFQVVLGSPMLLYAKSLGASATVLGLLTGMMPLLVIFQIPAASYINRVGYKRFVYAGWGIRVALIFVVALVPLTGGFLDVATRLVLILALLFGFNLSRGISSAGWLPWISSLVPAQVRGRYLSREAGVVNVSCFASTVLAALCVGPSPKPWQFALIFSFSAVAGAISLTFLKRIPEGTPPGDEGHSSGAVPWMAIVNFAPFKKLLLMVLAWAAGFGGMQAFTVIYLKDAAAMSEGRVLLVNSIFFLGGFCSLWFLGSRLDGLGSKPVLTFSFAIWLVLQAGWTMLAGGALTTRLSLVLGLQFLMGLFAALVTMSNTRLVMAIAPVMGRNHFFALFSVVLSVTQGLAPIAWGILIDAVGARRAGWAGLDWNNFSIFFAAVGAVFIVALVLARRLDEPEAASLDKLLREILVDSPQRVLVRLWQKE
jgi:MFS family permease